MLESSDDKMNLSPLTLCFAFLRSLCAHANTYFLSPPPQGSPLKSAKSSVCLVRGTVMWFADTNSRLYTSSKVTCLQKVTVTTLVASPLAVYTKS